MEAPRDRANAPERKIHTLTVMPREVIGGLSSFHANTPSSTAPVGERISQMRDLAERGRESADVIASATIAGPAMRKLEEQHAPQAVSVETGQVADITTKEGRSKAAGMLGLPNKPKKSRKR